MTAILALATLAAGKGGPVVRTRTIESTRIVALAAAPTGSRAVVSYEDGTVAIVDAATGKTVRRLTTHPQVAMAADWSDDGLYVATGDESGRVWIEDSRTGKKVREWRTHTRGIQKVSFDATRQYVMSDGKDDFIRVYDLTSPNPKEFWTLAGEGANFYGAAFHPRNPSQFIVGILGPSSRVYDVRSRKVVGFLTGNDSQGALDTDYNEAGTRAASAGKDTTVAVYDTKTYKKIASLKGHEGSVTDVAFSPDGRFIASSSEDSTVKLWNARSYGKLDDFAEQDSVGSPVTFTGDSKYLLSVNAFGFLQIRELTPGPKPVPVKKKKRG